MKVQIFKGYEGCLAARGVAVIIDVFRATTTICCLLQNQPNKIRLGRDVNDLVPYLSDPRYMCFSELKTSGIKKDNSPLLALGLQLKGKTAFLVTTNGTVAANLVKHCERTLAAAFVNLDAIVDFLWKLNPPEVSLIAIGNIDRNEEALEDNLCAETIQSKLLGENVVEYDIREKLAERIKQKGIPQKTRLGIDFSICSAIGLFNVVPEIIYENNWMSVIDIARENVLR